MSELFNIIYQSDITESLLSFPISADTAFTYKFVLAPNDDVQEQLDMNLISINSGKIFFPYGITTEESNGVYIPIYIDNNDLNIENNEYVLTVGGSVNYNDQIFNYLYQNALNEAQWSTLPNDDYAQFVVKPELFFQLNYSYNNNSYESNYAPIPIIYNYNDVNQQREAECFISSPMTSLYQLWDKNYIFLEDLIFTPKKEGIINIQLLNKITKQIIKQLNITIDNNYVNNTIEFSCLYLTEIERENPVIVLIKNNIRQALGISIEENNLFNIEELNDKLIKFTFISNNSGEQNSYQELELFNCFFEPSKLNKIEIIQYNLIKDYNNIVMDINELGEYYIIKILEARSIFLKVNDPSQIEWYDEQPRNNININNLRSGELPYLESDLVELCYYTYFNNGNNNVISSESKIGIINGIEYFALISDNFYSTTYSFYYFDSNYNKKQDSRTIENLTTTTNTVNNYLTISNNGVAIGDSIFLEQIENPVFEISSSYDVYMNGINLLDTLFYSPGTYTLTGNGYGFTSGSARDAYIYLPLNKSLACINTISFKGVLDTSIRCNGGYLWAYNNGNGTRWNNNDFTIKVFKENNNLLRIETHYKAGSGTPANVKPAGTASAYTANNYPFAGYVSIKVELS